MDHGKPLDQLARVASSADNRRSGDIWTDLQKDLSVVSLGAHHGVFIYGILHLLKTLPEIFKTLRETEESLVKAEGKQR